jgi:hypothetical protein
MTSVPLEFWPNNLSSLAWLGIVILLLIADIISYDYTAIGIMIMFGIFILDQLVLGPLWYMRRG